MALSVVEPLSEDALRELRSAVGAEHVFSAADSDLSEWRDPFQHATWDQYVAGGVVMPGSVEEVQAVVRIAARRGIPLWTSSQGRNNGYGGPAPRVRGSLLVSLKRMNRVLEIDEELGYAEVEPGVRWFDLYDAIQAGGHKLMLSVPDIGWGSVIGNTLDHGMTYLPYGVDMQMACGLEVVLADGTLLRTGMGAMPDNKSWHLYKRGLGPTLDQLFMQSNFGIVTKMGVWLMPEPEVYMPLWARVWRDDDLAPLVDGLRRLSLDDTIRCVPQILNTACYASAVTDRKLWWQGPGPIPDDVLGRMARELEIGRWLMRFGLFGDEAVVDHRFAKIKSLLEGSIDGAEVWGTKCAGSEIASLPNPSERVQGGVPGLELNAMAAWYGGEDGGHIGFSPIAPLTGDDALAVRNLLRGMIEEAGLDYMAVLIPPNARSFAHVTLIIFDTADEAQASAAYDVAKRLVRDSAALGYGEYRAHLDFMDLAAEQYSFGDGAYMRFVDKIKDAVDPGGVFAPGKQGIWGSSGRR